MAEKVECFQLDPEVDVRTQKNAIIPNADFQDTQVRKLAQTNFPILVSF